MTQMPLLVHRLRQLTDTLSTLRERVREAVATEFGKAVGQTVQDLIQMLARTTPERTPHDRRAVNKRKPIDATPDVSDQSRWSVAARTAAQVFCAWQAQRSRPSASGARRARSARSAAKMPLRPWGPKTWRPRPFLTPPAR